jgi:hypothetical protein
MICCTLCYIKLHLCSAACFIILSYTYVTLRYIYVMLHVKLHLRYAVFICGPGSSVGIATGYGLDGPRI